MIETPFLRNIWYVAGWASEFESVKPVGVKIIDEPVVLYRTQNGQLVALEDRCPHRWAPLSLGRIEGDQLRCMYHGAKYGTDGHCVEVPGQDHVGKSLRVRTYPVVERHRFAWIWMGDPASADPNLIPNLGLLDQPNRRVYTGSLEYDAHYSLVCDNLLDLSHINFLHERTLGRPVETVFGARPKPKIPGGSGAKPLDRGVRVEGWLVGSLARSIWIPKKVPDGDLWSRVDFLVPGVYVSQGRMYAEGTAEHCKGLPPGDERTALSDGMSIQAVTPIGRRNTRYFYSLGTRESDMDEAEFAAVWEIVTEAFGEDLQMIQAQQNIIDTYPGQRMGGIAADRGLVLFRDLIQRLAAEESSAGGASAEEAGKRAIS